MLCTHAQYLGSAIKEILSPKQKTVLFKVFLKCKVHNPTVSLLIVPEIM